VNEEWRALRGFEGIYIISREGRIRRIGAFAQNKDVKHQKSKRGYWTVRLYYQGVGKTLTVHRLLAEAFLPNPENKREVNHKNANKLDLRLENLEWVTSKENSRQIYKVQSSHVAKSYRPRGVHRHSKNSDLWQAQIAIDGKKRSLGLFKSKNEAYEKYRTEFVSHYGFEPW
jgi:hypothetical protein